MVRIVPDNAPLWHSLPLKYGYVEYLNEARKVLHIVTSDSNLVFCPLRAEWGTVKKGDFVSFRIYNSEGKNGKSLRCSDLTRVTEETASVLFPEAEVIVDNVNETKRLFHLTKIPGVLGGIVFFDDTQLRPLYGDRLVVRYYISKDKTGARKMKIIKIVTIVKN